MHIRIINYWNDKPLIRMNKSLFNMRYIKKFRWLPYT